MQTFKTFLTTFLFSVCVVLVSFAALYWMITPSRQPVDTHQHNVPVTKADSGDNKTTLVFLHSQPNSIFLLIKLNAVDCKASVTAIPSDFYISLRNRTAMQSFEYAGIMQCVQDLSEHLDITIDYHLVLDSETISFLEASFITKETADIIFAADCETAAALVARAIKNNISEIQSTTLPSIPLNFSYLYTSIGKTEAARLDRILTLLQRSNTEYSSSALTGVHPNSFP